MNRKDIIRMAQEAGAAVGKPAPDAPEIIFSQCMDVERFAALVASAERERLAKVFDELDKGIGFYDPHEPAEIIRSRGPKPPDSV